MTKPRVIKEYDAIDGTLKRKLRSEYPYGFQKKLITFKNAKGRLVTALPYETENRYFLIKMTSAMAAEIMTTEIEKSVLGEDEDNYLEVVDLVGEDAEIDLEKEVAAEANA